MARSFPMKKIRLGLPIAIIGSSVLVLLGLAGAFGYVLLGGRQVVVDARGIHLDGALYSKRVDRASIDMDGIRTVDLSTSTELEIEGKSNGFSVPGLREGYFDLANGKRAFVLLTDESRVVVVPTSGDWLLFSSSDPDKVVAALRTP